MQGQVVIAMLKGTLLMAGSIQQHGIYKGMDRRRVVKRTILPAMEHGSGHFCTWWPWLDMVATTSCPSSGVCTFMTFNRTLKWSKRSSRCFKTHWYPCCPKRQVHLESVCVLLRTAIYFNMLQGWFYQPREVSVEDHDKKICLLLSCISQLSWWPHGNDLDVVLVFYEDFKGCYESSVRSVAEFMGITDEGSIQVALERDTFEFYIHMHETAF